MLGLAGGDVRPRPQLDDERRRLERDVALAARARAAPPSRRGVDRGAVRAGRGPRRADPRDAAGRLAQPPSSSSPPATASTSAARIAATASSPRSWPIEQRVDAGGERQHGAALDADGVADGLHLERVGDHEPVVAELVAKQARTTAGLSVAGSVVERRDQHVRGHDRLHAGRDRGAERLEPVARRRPSRPAARGASRPRSSRGPGSAWRRRRLPGAAGPRTNAATWRETSAGSEPNERMPITGFARVHVARRRRARSRG